MASLAPTLVSHKRTQRRRYLLGGSPAHELRGQFSSVFKVKFKCADRFALVNNYLSPESPVNRPHPLQDWNDTYEKVT